MSEKTRKKKGGERKDKKNERMHEDVKERKESSAQHSVDDHKDQGDNLYQKKRGANQQISGGGPNQPGHG